MKAGSFSAVAAAMLLAAAASAAAQQPPPQPPPQPPVAAPLPPAPAALSVPNPLAGFRPGPADLYRSPDGSDRFQHGSLYPAPPPVIGPIYPTVIYPFGYPYGAPSFLETSMAETYRRSMAETYLRRQRAAARGSLLLQEVPTTAQVFVDGHYGIAEEPGPDGVTINLDAGAHRIEVRAPGYDTLTFSVMIEPNSLVRYRTSMQAVTTKPASATAQPAKSFYVIPNCYAGDKPPSGTLPKGCDIKNLKTRN